jgi:hypothetical protein
VREVNVVNDITDVIEDVTTLQIDDFKAGSSAAKSCGSRAAKSRLVG